MPEVDARILRLQQGVVTVVLLGGFVFQVPWMIPVATVLPGLDAALGRSGPTSRLWRAAIAPRLGPARSWEPPEVGRYQALAVFGVLVVATLLLLGDLPALATVLAILVAGVSAFAATGLFCLGAEMDRRSGGPRRRNRPQPSRPRRTRPRRRPEQDPDP